MNITFYINDFDKNVSINRLSQPFLTLKLETKQKGQKILNNGRLKHFLLSRSSLVLFLLSCFSIKTLYPYTLLYKKKLSCPENETRN
jgi:hypothetical protein